MNLIVERALPHWGMEGAEFELIAARENAVFRVFHVDGSVALRLHRKGYRTDSELRSELLWMKAVSEGGIKVPAPILAESGEVLLNIDGTQVDVLTWLSGTTLASALETRKVEERSLLFQRLGREMARVHEISDAWSHPAGFERVAWDIDGLVGKNPIWDRFWENPCLSSKDKDLLECFRTRADKELTHCRGELDYGLIHADLVPGNVMVSGNGIALIDFDDGGYGFRVFELATALHKFLNEEDYLCLREALIEGYTSVRNIDLTTLDLFLAVRSATYVGWNIMRLKETGAIERNTRFIESARSLTRNYLDGKATAIS